MKQFYVGTLLVIWLLAGLATNFEGRSSQGKGIREFGRWNKTPLEQPQILEDQFSFLPCDTRVSGVYTYCNPDNPGTFFVGFVAIDPTGTIRQVKDLGGAHATNLGKHVESLPNNEPAGTTTTPLVISGVGADTIEHWLFGPYNNGATFNIALVDTTASMCDTVKVASGTFNCEDFRSAPDSACADVVPLYYFDFSETTFDVPSASSNEVFLFMDRSRVSTCCGVPSSQRCFEFIIRLDDNDVGLDLSAAGSGAQGGDLYAAPLAGFNCSNSAPGNNDPWHVFVNNNVDPVICLGDTVKEWIVLTCKAGANPTSAIVDAVSGPNINDSVTIEPCNLNITATNTNDPKWSSYDDPMLKNIIGYSGVDSSVALFLYDESFYGPVIHCAGDTFHYVVSSIPPSSPCFTPNTRLFDTAAIIVYPTFTVDLTQACDMTGTMIKLTADTSSVAKGCPYTFTWYDLASPATIIQTGPSNMLTVGAIDGKKYRVVVTRSDLLSSVNSCSPVADTITLIAGAQINCDLVLPKDTLLQCLADTLRSNPGLITFDGCYQVAPTVLVKDISDGGKGCKGDTLKIRRLYIAEVSTGVFDTCVQRFNIVDTIPPSPALLTSDKTIECNSFTLITDTSVAVVGPAIPGTDNCNGRVIITHRDSIVTGVCPARDTILRLWKSSDTCGNFRIQVQRIIRIDTKPPIPSFTPHDTTVVCASNIPAPLALMGLDSCQGMVTAAVKDTVFATDSVCLDKKIVRRTYTYKDLCGNMTNSLQLIRVNDSIAPVLTCPPNITVTCVADTPVSNTTLVTAIDNCGSHVRVNHAKDSVSTADPAPCLNKKIFYRIYEGLDTCNNIGSCVQVIRVNDSINPVLICPKDTTVNCAADIPATSIASVLATDNCAGSVTVQFVKDSVSGADSICINKKIIYRIYSGIDICMNDTFCIQKITVIDTIAPTLLGVPRDTTVDCAGSIPALPSVTAMDNCILVRLDYRREVQDSNCINQKTILNIWTATDTCHNMVIDTQTIIVNDTIAPIFTAFPKDTTYDCIGNVPLVPGIGCLNCVPVAPYVAPTASDNCGSVQVQYIKDTIIDSTCINNKTILRIWSATDLCNNMIRDTQMIKILDTIPPQFTIPNNIDTVECGQIFDIVFPGAPAQDNCDGSVMIKSSISIIDSTCPGNYKILLTFTARDTCGNTKTLTDTIVKLDRIRPIIECPQDIETANCDDIPPPFATLDSFLAHGGTVTDMCCIDSASFESLPQSSTSNSGTLTITRKYVIHDCCGLTDTCMQTIIVPPCFLDLALKKEINGPTPFFTTPGGIIPFKIIVYNQLDVPSDSIKIIDYLPSPTSTIITPGWVNNGNSTACLTLSRANGLLPASGLLLGDSVVITFDLKLGNGAFGATAINIAEIFSAQDTFHNTLNDIDSKPNSVPGDDPGGIADGASDNVVDGDGTGAVGVDDPTGDEDDQDPALFFICNSLICNDKVNVSLDLNCEHCFSAADVLQGNVLPDQFYDIEITDATGRKIDGKCIGREWLGYQLTYKVTSHAPCPVTSCWGYVVLEDKKPPLIDCRPDTVTCFELAQLPHGTYTVKDNCGDSTKVVIASETFTDYGCGEPGANQTLQGKVSRRLIASDVWGNSIDCTKDYFILKIELDSVKCPADFELGCNSTSFAPSADNAPIVNTPKGIKSLWPNNVSCKINLLYTDKRVDICGKSYKIIRSWIITDWCTGKEKICTQTISILDKVAPVPINDTLPSINADPHNCGQFVNLPALAYSDCNSVTQTYTLKYDEEGKIRVLSGVLPASHVWLPIGTHKIVVNLVDACNNFSNGSISVSIKDITPPTPVCVEYTQVTVDPASCWAAIAAVDLNSGSQDNCISQLHYAAALLSEIEKARTDYTKRITDSCGKDEYWNNKAWYDAYIEQWINCYVFTDTVHFDDCGSNQVVMRVYEADSMPRLDPHLWTCGEHAWFCYNTYPDYRFTHNISFFDTEGKKDCKATAPWLCKAAHNTWRNASKLKVYNRSYYIGANADANFPQTHLFNDCMVQVLVDDKQAPVVASLEDITLNCDGVTNLINYSSTPGAPAGGAYARLFCESSESYSPWPGTIKDGKGTIHGYYGGSTYIVNHSPGNDHADPTGCPTDQWSPIYCRKWLLLDSFDQAGQINPKDYFDVLVMFDKNRPSRALKGNEFSITDNCKLDDASLKVTDAGSLNGCGEGWIQRTWTMTDKCGNPVTATQKIIVKHRSDFEVIFPADIEVSCEASDAVDTSHTGIPVISDDDCEQIGVRYEDEISTVTDGACYKIIRTWTLIDWCVYDPNIHTNYPDVIVDDRLRANQTDRACVMRNIKDNGDGYMKYVQIIKVTDHQAPVVSCKDTTICITEGCKTLVNIPLNGTDNCAEKVLFRLDIAYPDQHIETRLDVNAITGSFFEGIYKVRIIGRDHCGNEDTCDMNLTVKDCKAPTPYCLNGVATVVMPSIGSIQIWATDLDRASADNCTATNNLKFSFSKNTGDASRILTCKDIPNGKEQALELSIWVTDEAGNSDFCKTYVLLQDNGGLAGGVCKDTTIAMASVTGKLKTEFEEGVEFATVEVTGGGSAGIPSFKTKSDGGYLFGSIPLNANQIIRANRDDNPINGVSTLDLILIQKHILGSEPLNSAYKVIAADVNNSDDVSILDLIELRKLILGIYDKLPNNTSWKFIPQSHVFNDIQNPWGYPTEEKLRDMKDIMQKDFVGVKIGDVNSSALAHSLMGTEVRGTGAGLVLDVVDQSYRRGDKVSIQFMSSNFKGISGFQGTLNIDDNSLMFDHVEDGVLQMNGTNFGRRWEKEGQITMSWNASDISHGQSVDLGDDETLFTLTFTASSDGRLSDVFHLSSQRTLAESYEGKGEIGTLGLRFINSRGEVEEKSTLYQNYPNPFDQRTVIGVQLSEPGKGILKITDITGRTLKLIDQVWNKGYQEVWLDRRDIRASGILYYSFESLPSGAGRGFKAVKKMIILDE